MGPTLDTLQRPLRNLRISVTDRCNLRCAYCMPEQDYTWLATREILRFEEIGSLVDRFIELGVDKVRLTGGEPLLRRDLDLLVHKLARKKGLKDLALTTNGVFLEEQAGRLKAAGLHRVTVSLDTLKPERFREISRRDDLPRVLKGIDAARRAGFPALKIDTVVMRGVNDDELVPMIEYGKQVGAEVRFIEYMDVGGATLWSMDKVVTRAQMLEQLSTRYGEIRPIVENSSAPAERFELAGGTRFGIIASTTAPFCRSCDRSRLTADGVWYQCLYAKSGLDLKTPLRASATPEALRALISSAWNGRADRGAEQRLAMNDGRSPLFDKSELQGKPHLEMHTRGG